MIHLSAMKRYFLFLCVVLPILMLWTCKSPNSPVPPDPPDDPQEQITRLSGKVTDVDNGNTVSGAVVKCYLSSSPDVVYDSFTTDASGNFTIEYPKGANLNPKIVIEHANYITRITYVSLRTSINSIDSISGDYSIVPSSYDSHIFNVIMRESERPGATHVTKIWRQQPKYRIITTDMDVQTKAWIYDVLSTNESAQLTYSVISGTTSPEESTVIPGSDSNYVVFMFSDDFTTEIIAKTLWDYNPAAYELNRARVMFNKSKRNSITRGAVLHEFARALGHLGTATDRQMLLGDGPTFVHYITTWDIQNGKWAYARPPGNEAPDNDISPTGWTTGVMSAPSFNMPSIDLNPFKLSERNSMEPRQRIITKRKKKHE